MLKKELEFWRIDELTIEPCCALKYYPEIEQVGIAEDLKNIATIPQTGGEGEKGGGGEQGEGGGQASRRKLWRLKVGQVPHICLEPDGVPGNIQSCPGVKYHFLA